VTETVRASPRDGPQGGGAEDRIEIRETVIEAMRGHAGETLPDECCGLLVASGSVVSGSVRARNLEPRPDRFVLDPVDHLAAIRGARQRGERVVGVYHSHPAGDAVPSGRDVREAGYSEYVHVIVSGQSGDVRAYRLADGRFREVGVRVVP